MSNYKNLTFLFLAGVILFAERPARCLGQSQDLPTELGYSEADVYSSYDDQYPNCSSTVPPLSSNALQKELSAETSLLSNESQTASSSKTTFPAKDDPAILLSDEEFVELLTQSCEQLKNAPKPDADALAASQKKLNDEILRLKQTLRRGADAKKVSDWEKYLELDAIQKELVQKNPQSEVFESAANRFEVARNDVKGFIFSAARDSLKEYLSTLNRTTATPDEEKTFQQACDFLPTYIERLLENYNADASEATTVSLDLLRRFSFYSPTTQKITSLVLKRFSNPNFQVVAHKDLLIYLPQNQQIISEPINVAEDIRGTFVQGQGTMNGITTFRFAPNDIRAEIQLVIDSTVQTKTTGFNRGATIASTSDGKVQVQKSIFVDREIQTEPAKVASLLCANITGVNPGRIIGARIVNKKVAEEKPLSEAESKRRMELRFANRVDSETDGQIGLLNESFQNQWMQPFVQKNIIPRQIISRTTTNNLFWTSLVGGESQLGLQTGTDFAPESDPNASVSIQIHQSCPNNILFSFFSGQKLNDRELKDKINDLFAQKRIGNVDFNNENDESPLLFQFAKELPAVLNFDKDEITISMKFDGFEKDERDYPELDVEIVYQIIRNEKGLILKKKIIDAYPGGIERGTTIPARYQAVRRVVVRQLEAMLKNEIAFDTIDVSSITANSDVRPDQLKTQSSKQGASVLIVPKNLTATDGWLNIEFDVRKTDSSTSEPRTASNAIPNRNARKR